MDPYPDTYDTLVLINVILIVLCIVVLAVNSVSDPKDQDRP